MLFRYYLNMIMRGEKERSPGHRLCVVWEECSGDRRREDGGGGGGWENRFFALVRKKRGFSCKYFSRGRLEWLAVNGRQTCSRGCEFSLAYFSGTRVLEILLRINNIFSSVKLFDKLYLRTARDDNTWKYLSLHENFLNINIFPWLEH